MEQTGESKRVLFVFAHPDDETLNAGATIAHLIARGDDVLVLTATRGEHGEVIPDRLAHLREDPTALAAYRDQELRRALTELGGARQLYLGGRGARAAGLELRRYRDSGMEWNGTHPVAPAVLDPDSLCAAPVEEVAADIAAVVTSWAPDVVVTENSTGGYGHPDHRRIHQAVLRAVNQLPAAERPLAVFGSVRPARVARDEAAAVARAGWFHPLPRGPQTTVPDRWVDAVIRDDPEAVSAKKRALAAYETQFRLRDGQLGHSDGRGQLIDTPEAFRLVQGTLTRSTDHPLPDFVEGWDEVATRDDGAMVNARTGAVLGRPRRWRHDVPAFAGWLFAGVALGAIAAVGHRATVADLPVGFPLTLVAIASALVAVRRWFVTSLPVGGLAVGVIVAIAVLVSTGPGGSVLFPASNVVLVDSVVTAVDNVSGMVWIVAATGISAMVALWPRGADATIRPYGG